MAEYPRLLRIDKETASRLISYLDEEIWNHGTERDFWVKELERWQKDYWAKPSTKVKKFPFYGASNLVVPLAAISVEAVHARMMQTLFGTTPIVSVNINPRMLPPSTDHVFEQYMDFELMKTMQIRKPFEDMALEGEKYGTMVGKSGFERNVKRAVREFPDPEDPTRTIEEDFEVVTKSTAVIDAVPQVRFMMRFQNQDPQTAPWCGEEHSWDAFMVKMAERDGLFYSGTYEKLLPYVTKSNQPIPYGSGQQFTHSQETLEDKRPVWPRRLDFYEFWLSFIIDGKNETELQVFYHREAQLLMGIRYNWYDDLHRPYRIGQYIPVEHRWSGIGVCKQVEQFQREVTTIHRQRLDNGTIANMRMFKVHKLSGYGPEEPIFPGKMWFLDDMSHIEAVQIGEIYQSSYANEQSSIIYSQQRSGVNEVTLGMPQVGTPGTATGDIARIQEGNKKFDYSMNNFKGTYNELILDAILNMKQFGTQNMDYVQSVDNGELIAAVMSQPADALRRGVIFQIQMAGAQANRVLDRQSWKEISVILTQYYQSMIQLGSMTRSPQLMAVIVRKAFTAATEAMKQLLETYEIRNIDRVVLSEVEAMLNAAQQGANNPALLGPGGSGNNGGGSSGLITPGTQPGMDLLSALVPATAS